VSPDAQDPAAGTPRSSVGVLSGSGLSEEPTDGPSGGPPAGPGSTASDEHGPIFWVVLAVGWAVIIFAIHGMIAQRANPPQVWKLLIGLNIVNDALVAPALVVVAFGVRRIVPGWLVAPLDVGLIASAVVTLYAYPLVGSWGKSAAAGYSRLPFDYAHSLLMVLGAIWFVCALLAVWSWSRKRPQAN
jgi:hypothetical protein